MTTLNVTTLAQVQLTQVIEQLKVSDDLITIHNDYCESVGCYDDNIRDNDEYNINNEYEDNAYRALRSQFNGNYNVTDNYFYLDGYANLVSFNYMEDDKSPICFSELAQWIVDNELYNDFDIEVTTLDDMLASIEDNITDDENMLYKLCDYLVITYNASNDAENLIGDCMYKIDGYCYESLQDIITHLNINYN